MPREIQHYDMSGRPLLDDAGRPVVTLHYTITEVAEAIGVHRSTVLRMAERGDVATDLIGSRWYVSGTELARLTAEGLW
jgi:excisionase family DNA binding protein